MYDYPRYNLRNDPLSVVLCQVRFSRVRKIGELIPTLQDRLRRSGYPEDTSGVVQQFSLPSTPENPPQPGVRTQTRNEFRSKDNCWSLAIVEDMLALVTTDYNRFEDFRGRLEEVLQIIDEVVELRYSQVHRVGLRYIDAIEPSPNETFRDYLQESLHGPKTSIFADQDQILHLESIAPTAVGNFILRITQNKDGILVPLNLIFKPMKHKQEVERGKLITLVDSDHFMTGAWDYDLPSILEAADTLHGGINKAWFTDIVTKHALEVWGAELVTS
jgi:uncharacterized protein (TIGR04255 family)